MEMDKIIGARIRKLRTDKGWSQEEAASRINISRSAFSGIERGDTGAWAKYLETISEVFEVHPAELIPNEDKLVQNNNDYSSGVQKVLIMNQYLSDKAIEQYEIRIREKDERIAALEERVRLLEGRLGI